MLDSLSFAFHLLYVLTFIFSSPCPSFHFSLAVRGPGVMQGYIHDAAATAAVMDAEGYFNTGDLVRINPATGERCGFSYFCFIVCSLPLTLSFLLAGDLIITGRHKDTIVLSNGENIAPEPIEDGIVGSSSLVDQVKYLRCVYCCEQVQSSSK